MNDVIKSLFITSTDSLAPVANLLHEIIMVRVLRDHFLMLPQWFTCDDINDIMNSEEHP